MSEKKWPGPPAGVSTTDGQGGHTQVKPPPSKGHRRQVGEDVLRNVEELRVVKDDSGMNPSGAKALKRDVRIGKMPKMRRSNRNHVTFSSIDGEDYTFRIRDTKGKELEYIRTQVLYICLRELSLGGSALPVLKAFNVHFSDELGKPFLPVSDEIFVRMSNDEEIDEVSSSFALGSAD